MRLRAKNRSSKPAAQSPNTPNTEAKLRAAAAAFEAKPISRTKTAKVRPAQTACQ